MLAGIVIGVGCHIFIKKELGHEWGTKKYWMWLIPSIIVLNGIVSLISSMMPVVHR